MTRIFRILCGVTATAALLGATSCGSRKAANGPIAPLSNPLVPSPASAGPTRPPATSMTITVTDGWTGTVVPGATVTAGGSEVLTDAKGTFVLTTAPVKCLPLDIVATGF